MFFSEDLIVATIFLNARSGPGINMIFFAFPDERQKESSPFIKKWRY
jgi:hypothetical protein